MPNAEFDLSEQQVKDFIDSLTHETRFRFIRALPAKVLWANFDELEVEELDIQRTEDGEKPGLVCPHCHEVFAAQRLQYVDVAFHQSSVSSANTDKLLVWLGSPDPDNIEWEHLVLLCPECTEPVNLPKRWDHDHI